MATNFFERQDRARRNTGWLIGLFVVGTLLIVGAVSGLTFFVLANERDTLGRLGSGFMPDGSSAPFRWDIVGGAGVGTAGLIGGASLLKGIELRASGGAGLAERLGGKRLTPNTNDPAERRLLNVVDEMALASGVPAPPVFLMEKEDGINAFAAGYSPSDAVIGVTRGCVQQLTRDQLQGVVAHEFSHILNGDMRLNLRMIGFLFGILVLGIIGRIVFRIAAHSGGSRRDSKEGGSAALAFLLIGLALIVLGSLGSLIGGMIKAAISREREYLADASAVQFTRNPQGIAGALMRIGGLHAGSKLQAPAAAEASHLYFAQGIWEGFGQLMATHPPLAKRIRAIDPNWDGAFLGQPGDLSASAPLASQASGLAGVSQLSGAPLSGESAGRVPLDVVDHASEQIGTLTNQHRSYAQRLIGAIPAPLIEAAHDPCGARALVFGLLLDNEESVRQAQAEALRTTSDAFVVKMLTQLMPAIDALDERCRLPLVDLAMPALKSISPAQYRVFSVTLRALVEADNRLGLFEWVLGQVLARNLRPQFERVKPPAIRFYGVQKLGAELSQVLSTLAYVGGDDRQAGAAFADAKQRFPESDLRLLDRGECGMDPLRHALDTLTQLADKHRVRLVDACAAAICTDGTVTLREAELLRGVSDLLDCPMPPLLAGQQTR